MEIWIMCVRLTTAWERFYDIFCMSWHHLGSLSNNLSDNACTQPATTTNDLARQCISGKSFSFLLQSADQQEVMFTAQWSSSTRTSRKRRKKMRCGKQQSRSSGRRQTILEESKSGSLMAFMVVMKKTNWSDNKIKLQKHKMKLIAGGFTTQNKNLLFSSHYL